MVSLAHSLFPVYWFRILSGGFPICGGLRFVLYISDELVFEDFVAEPRCGNLCLEGNQTGFTKRVGGEGGGGGRVVEENIVEEND